jgi:hypothetical protein
MRQPITIHAQSLENLIYQLARNYLDKSSRSRYNKLVEHLKNYHTICLDRNTNWIEHYKNGLAELVNVNRFEYGEIVRKLIDSDLTEFIKMYFLGFDTKSDEIEKLCIEIAEKSSSKILVCDKKLKYEKLKNYSIKEFNERNDKLTNLLRKEKVCSFNKGETIEGFKFLEPFIMYAKQIVIYDEYLFKESEDYMVISTIFQLAIDPKEIIIATKFNDARKDHNIKNNLEQLRLNFPNTNIKVAYYREHERKILTEYSKIVLSHSLNNISTDDKNKLIIKKEMTFSATLIHAYLS